MLQMTIYAAFFIALCDVTHAPFLRAHLLTAHTGAHTKRTARTHTHIISIAWTWVQVMCYCFFVYLYILLFFFFFGQRLGIAGTGFVFCCWFFLSFSGDKTISGLRSVCVCTCSSATLWSLIRRHCHIVPKCDVPLTWEGIYDYDDRIVGPEF